VGAAIAAGNQLIKGNWALLVILIPKIKKLKIKILKFFILKIKNEKNINKKTSPTRFLRNVNILLFKVVQFLKKLTKIKEEIPRPSQPINKVKILFLNSNIIIEQIKIIRTIKKYRKFLFLFK
jgi:hypothetical protein